MAVGHTGSALTFTQQKYTANHSRTRLTTLRHWAPVVQIELYSGATPREHHQGLDAATRTMVVKTQKVKANKWRILYSSAVRLVERTESLPKRRKETWMWWRPA